MRLFKASVLTLALLPQISALALAGQHAFAAQRTPSVSRTSSLVLFTKEADGLVNSMQSAVMGSWQRLTDFRCARRRFAVPPRRLFYSLLTLALNVRVLSCSVARASHILLKGYSASVMQQMEAYKAEIGDDADKFAEIAKTASICPSRKKGGDLGYFTRGKMVKEFDAVVFGEQPGAVYGPVRSDFGTHLIFIHSCQIPKERKDDMGI